MLVPNYILQMPFEKLKEILPFFDDEEIAYAMAVPRLLEPLEDFAFRQVPHLKLYILRLPFNEHGLISSQPGYWRSTAEYRLGHAAPPIFAIHSHAPLDGRVSSCHTKM